MHRELSWLPLGLLRGGKPLSEVNGVRLDDKMVPDNSQHCQRQRHRISQETYCIVRGAV